MKLLKISLFALLVTPILTNCDDFTEHTVEPIEVANVDFSKYVSIGNSLAAGFQSNALYPEGQIYSYPNLLAQQFRVDQFALPAIGNGYGDLVKVSDFSTYPDVGTTVETLTPGVTPTQPEGGYQNLGIPGAVLNDFRGTDRVPAFGSNIPYTSRFSAPYAFVLGATPTPIQEYFDNQNATFTSFWLGNNDILGYVTSGGLRPFTSPAAFQTEYAASIAAIMGQDSYIKGVVANIPGVTSIPFTTYVGPRAKANLTPVLTALNLTDIYVQSSLTPNVPAVAMPENKFPYMAVKVSNLDNVDSALVLLTAQSALGWIGASTANPNDNAKTTAILNYWRSYIVAATAATLTPVDAATAAGMDAATVAGTLKQITIAQYMQTFSVDQATASNELTARGFDFNFAQPFGLHPHNPFPSQFFLDKNEIAVANAVTTTFNTIISSVRSNYSSRLAFVDVNTIFAGIVAAGGIQQNGIGLAPAMGSLFSFDGVHPSNRGHGVITNFFIDAINNNFFNGDEVIKHVNISWIPTGLTVVNNPN
ncbi:hypothetical protein EP331_04445 [bacterium]|nr:MAG: hypothetical protein EP331_04445 [bacterium]